MLEMFFDIGQPVLAFLSFLSGLWAILGYRATPYDRHCLEEREEFASLRNVVISTSVCLLHTITMTEWAFMSGASSTGSRFMIAVGLYNILASLLFISFHHHSRGVFGGKAGESADKTISD